MAANKSPPRRGGARPARGITATPTYRANRTGRIYASPTNLPEMGALPITTCRPTSHYIKCVRLADTPNLNSKLLTLHSKNVSA